MRASFSAALPAMAAVSPLSASSTTPAAHPEKRRKITRACDACKAKKKRCTGTQPCPSCEKGAKPCTYLASYTRGRFTTPPSSRGLDALILAAESHDVNFADRDRRPSSSARTEDANAASPALSRGPQSPPDVAAQRHHSLGSAYTLSAPSPAHVFAQPQAPSYLPPLPTFQTPQPNGAAAPDQRRASLQPLLSASDQWRSAGVHEPASKATSRRPSPEPDGNFDGHYLGPSSSITWLRRALRKLGQTRSLKEKLPEEASHESPKDVTIYTFGDKTAPSASLPPFSLPSPSRAEHLVTRYFEFAAPTYRFLHRPTLESWLAAMHEPNPSIHPARQAAVLVILAIATLYELSRLDDPELDIRRESEMYYREAQSLLGKEAGPATLESVQARFALVHYLLSTGRSNQAWFTFGTTVQLAMALGLHRRRTMSEKHSLIVQECQRRLFWSMYTMDRYLSVMFGRPKWMQDDDISQEYPLPVNDEDLTATEIRQPGQNDCLEDAAIFHSKLTRIVGKAAKEQYTAHTRTEAERMAAAAAHNRDLREWKSELPAYLSGAIKPSSLIGIFRRQSTVLRVAHAHAVMLVNRPFLLSNLTKHGISNPATRHSVDECLGAARIILDMVLTYITEGQPFSSFWFTQYIAFNALSIVYLYLLQSRRQGHDTHIQYQDLLSLANTCQQYLADMTEANAPSMRYNIILEELREELTRLSKVQQNGGGSNGHAATNGVDGASMANGENGNAMLGGSPRNHHALPSDSAILLSGGAEGGTVGDAALADGDGSSIGELQHHLDWDLDFWPQLDSLPMTYSNFNEPLANLAVPSA